VYNVFQVRPVALLLPWAPALAAAHACPPGPRLLARPGALPARARRAVRARSWLSTPIAEQARHGGLLRARRR